VRDPQGFPKNTIDRQGAHVYHPFPGWSQLEEGGESGGQAVGLWGWVLRQWEWSGEVGAEGVEGRQGGLQVHRERRRKCDIVGTVQEKRVPVVGGKGGWRGLS